MKFYLLLFLTIITAIVFLLKPAPKGNWSGEYIRINSYSGVFLNSDSYNFCKEASDLNSLFDTTSVRQDRPAYLLVVNLLSRPIKSAVNFLNYHFKITKKIDYTYLDKVSNRIINNPDFEVKQKPVFNILPYYFHIYLSFVVLNILILFLTVSLFEIICTKFFIDKKIRIIFISILLFNRVTKAYLLNVHMQLFILFTPLLFVYSFYKIINSNFSMKSIYLSSFFMGLMSLFYGSFIFYFPALFLVLIYEFYNKSEILAKWHVFISSFILCILPTVIWINILTHVTGKYYNHEVERFREFVWIVDTLKVSFILFFTTFIKFAFAFSICIAKSAFIYLIILSVVITKAKENGIYTYRNILFISLYSILIVFSACFLLLGFYQVRLTFTLVPVLFVMISILWQELINKKILFTEPLKFAYLFVIINALYVVFTNSYYQ